MSFAIKNPLHADRSFKKGVAMQEGKCLLSQECHFSCLGELKYALGNYIGPAFGTFVGMIFLLLVYILWQHTPRQGMAISFDWLVFSVMSVFFAASGLAFWMIEKRVKRNWCRHCR